MTSTFHHEASVFVLKDLKIKSDVFSSCLLYRCYFMLDALLCYIFNHHLLNIIHNKKNTLLFLIESPLIYFRFRPRDSSYTSSGYIDWIISVQIYSTRFYSTGKVPSVKLINICVNEEKESLYILIQEC